MREDRQNQCGNNDRTKRAAGRHALPPVAHVSIPGRDLFRIREPPGSMPPTRSLKPTYSLSAPALHSGTRDAEPFRGSIDRQAVNPPEPIDRDDDARST